ncbi:MAG: DNA primase [Chlamydiota bacterium]
MPRFSKDSLQALRDKVDLVELIGSYLPLKTQGAKKVGLCPFHEEKTPSFMVQNGDRHYHCFGCGAHGDAIQFLMNFLKISFVEAVELLAEKFHVSLEEKSQREYQGPSRALLKDVLETASRFYQAYLLHTHEGRKALAYLYSRGIDLEFIRSFGIGLSPEKRGVFQKYMQAKNVKPELLEKTGLIRKVQGKEYDFFSGRVMIPILDRTSATIGFTARKHQEGTFGPKYINTPETSLFKKSQVLFGLAYARKAIVQERSCVIVEGQIDALRLLQGQFMTTVASQGTAFTEDQVKILLSMGVEQVFLGFDPDTAGKNSAEKVGHLFQKEGVDVAVIDLPEGEDPDTILMEKGPLEWKRLLQEAPNYLTFLYDKKQQEVPVTSPAMKNKIVTEIADAIRSWEKPLLVHESLRSLAKIAQVPDWTLGIEEESDVTIPLKPAIAEESFDPGKIIEEDFLRILLLFGESDPSLATIAKENLSPEELKNASARRLYSVYLDLKNRREEVDFLTLSQDLTSEEQTFLENLLQKRVNQEKAKGNLIASVQRILEKRWMEKREEIKNKIISASLDEEETLALAKEFDELKKEAPQVQV